MSSTICRFSFLVPAAFLALTLLPVSSQAASGVSVSTTPDADKFDIRLGGFALQDIKTSMRLDGSNGQIGDNVDFEKTLGGDDNLTVFRVDADWRFAPKHRVQFAYFDIDMSASKTLSANINWGDDVYPVNARVDSGLRTSVYKLNYAYSFYRNQNHEVAGQIGAHITKIEAFIGLPSAGKKEGGDVTAPLPVIGLEWKAKLGEKWFSQVSYQYFGVSLEDDKYSGDLSDFLAVVNYRLSRHWYVGGGFNRYVLNAELQGTNKKLKFTLKHEYNGFILHLGANF
jgi:hypothetical protein